MVGTFAVPKRNLNRVPQVLVRSWFSVNFNDSKVDLMHVKSMRLKGAILDRPVLNRSHLRRNYRLLIMLEDLLLLSVDGDIELDRPVCSSEFLREVEFSLNGGRQHSQAAEPNLIGRGRR